MIPPLQRSDALDAQTHRLAWATWPADLATPVTLLRALRGAGHQACLLESVEGLQRLARHSFVGIDPEASLRGGPDGYRLTHADGTTQELPGDARRAVREASARLIPVVGPSPAHLPPFQGGWVGSFGYEWACALEPRVPRPADAGDDVVLDLYRRVLAVDHSTQRIHVIVPCDDGAAGLAEAHAAIDAIIADALGPPADSRPFRLGGEWSVTLDDDAYMRGVSDLRAQIAQGEIFQAVLSRRFSRPCEGDPVTLYRALRLTNPSPHMFFFEADGVTLVGSSPERIVSVRCGQAEVQPVAGTRPRSDDPSEDDRLAGELRGDAKERAEHDMLVDLGRNDLGRVARIGSVVVREYAALQRFARVQHLVSRVNAELAAGQDGLDALAACFPAGTVSGAPKVRAMELIARAESGPRGAYAGAFGYIDAHGDLDMALVIRSFVLAHGEVSVQAGAGIVWDSDPAAEAAETAAKASALLAAAELAAGASFSPAPRARAVADATGAPT